jgi:hypothetical protein
VREVAGSNPVVPTISSYAMNVPLKFLLLALVAACLVLAAWFIFRKAHSPKSASEALTWAIELQEAGRYDKAVQLLQTWMKGPSRDTSRDGFLYQQIAMIYIVKAYKKPKTRDDSIRQSERNLVEAQRLFDQHQILDIDTDLFGIGGAYEILGDLSDKDKCRLYEIGRQALERQLPLIKGDSYTAYGKTVPLEPLRADVRKHLDAVNKKSSTAGCQVH